MTVVILIHHRLYSHRASERNEFPVLLRHHARVRVIRESFAAHQKRTCIRFLVRASLFLGCGELEKSEFEREPIFVVDRHPRDGGIPR